MAIHWQIRFQPLRETVAQYTINIYDASYSGAAVPLRGAAQPITTQEDDDEDMFAPIRLQTGYIRIVDNGFDLNGGSFNWKTLVPNNDTDRPVTLTKTVNGTTVTVWQGFMQAQNFGAELYLPTQERAYPIQCALAVTGNIDVNHTHKEIENFAYLLREVLNGIDTAGGGAVAIENVYVQGGTDAGRWLLKRIDWQNFVEDSDTGFQARFGLLECLEDICRFWGWTARTYHKNLYLVRPDDTASPTFAVISRAQLTQMADAHTESWSVEAQSSTSLSGNIFASTDNEDMKVRGFSKAVVKGDANTAEADLWKFNEDIEELMVEKGFTGGDIYYDDDKSVQYTKDLLSFSLPLLTGTCTSGAAAFAVGRIVDESSNTDHNMIRFKTSYSGALKCRLTTVYHHNYSGGRFLLSGNTYRHIEKLTVTEEGRQEGGYTMYMRLGVGRTRNNAVWFNGVSWGNIEAVFKMTIGNSGRTLYVARDTGARVPYIPSPNAEGLVYVEFLGSDDLEPIDGQRFFEIEDFTLEFKRVQTLDDGRISTDNMESEKEYMAKNSNRVREEFDANCCYASDANLAFGYGLVIDTDGTYLKKAVYGATSMPPEQNLANRVVNYWSSSRRKITAELQANQGTVSVISPKHKVVFDGGNYHPASISREWCDDVLKVSLVEIP